MKIKKELVLIDKFDNQDLRNEIIENIKTVKKAIKRVNNPKGSDQFLINTKPTKNSKGKTIKKHQNGVKPIRKLFKDILLEYPNWKDEESSKRIKYKFKNPILISEKFKGWGPLDFSIELKSGLELNNEMVVEWETGNISSSHRAMNKMLSAMYFSNVKAGILIVPVKELYDYLTDRTGNFKELLPYIPFWEIQRENPKLQNTYLEIIGVSYDAIDKTIPYIPKDIDGRAEV